MAGQCSVSAGVACLTVAWCLKQLRGLKNDQEEPDTAMVVPYLPSDLSEPAELLGRIRERRAGRLLNLDRILLHSPNLTVGWNAFYGCIRAPGCLAVSPKLKELAICFVGVLNGAEYEVYQHLPVFLEAGGTQEQAASLRTVVPGPSMRLPSCYSSLEGLVLKLAYHVTRTIQVPKPLLRRLQHALGDQQLVEIVTAIAAYNGVSRVLVALGITAEGEEPP